ncbi:MAG TPA: ketopantoate reductase C-terminal domain-containing protein [Planctomycetota bacterium]|nr:ketopantoate reductase C-terminal domain-containing protein [Planctomycetota bacterium]
MSCIVIGPGLVGSFLGAAAGATAIVAGASGRPRALRAALPQGLRRWQPTPIALRDALAQPLPILIAARAHQTPWDDLPEHALAAQNGLGQRVPVATCFFALDLIDGTVVTTGPRPRLVVARPDRRWDGVLAAWSAAGIAVEICADARPAQWEKAILNATVGPLCLGTGLDMAQVWGDPGLKRLVIAATGEGIAVAAACGVEITAGLDARAAAFFAAVGAHQPSVVRDPGELPWVLGHLLRQARRHDVATPALARIAALAGAGTTVAAVAAAAKR